MTERKKTPKTQWWDFPHYTDEEDESYDDYTGGFLNQSGDSGAYSDPDSGQEDFHMTASEYRRQNPRKKPGDEMAKTQEMSAPQLNKIVEELRFAVETGGVPAGNVELAAVPGYRPAQIVLGRKPGAGMKPNDFIEWLLTDPSLKITINVE